MTDVDIEAIHSRGLERARRIDKAHIDAALHEHPTAALAAAFQAAGDALHAEADAATEAKKRGHQSLTKDLRNAAGRLVGIAQDLMELSKLDDQISIKSGDVIPASALKVGNTISIESEGHYTPATDPVTSQADVAAYLRGETDELPAGPLTPDEIRLIEASDDAGAEGAAQAESVDQFIDRAGFSEDAAAFLRGTPTDIESPYYRPTGDDAVTGVDAMLAELAFADPEPYRGSKTWTPEGGVAYTYADLMRPVDPAVFPDHWSWSQLTSLEECGVKYRGQRLELIPQQPQWSLIGGKAFHAVTERFDVAAWQAGGADLLPVAGDDLIKERWRDAFAAEINRTAAETGIEMGETGDNYRAAQGGKEGYTWWLIEGEWMLALYVHNRRKLDQAGRAAGQLRTPLELASYESAGVKLPVIEYAYKRKLDVPTGTLTIEGVIDRAYTCADGSLLVTDLKTGRLPNQTGQLGEYAWTLADLLNWPHKGLDANEMPPIRGNFYDARKGLFTDPIDLLATHPHEEYVFRYGAADAARRMGVFLPHRSTFCAGCSIRWACPVGGA